VACDELEHMLRTIFEELLANENIDKNQIIQIKVLSDYHKCTTWLTKLKKYQNMLEATKNVNKGDTSKKLKISKKGGLFGLKSTEELDAIDFYNKKI
jgi:ribosome-binding factor A